MGKTTIEWCDHSVNPIRATVPSNGPLGTGVGHYCEKISPGCANCYASALQRRFRMPEFGGVTRDDQTVLADGTMRNGARPYSTKTCYTESSGGGNRRGTFGAT